MSTDVTKDLLDALKGLMALSDHRVDLRDQAKAARSAIAAAEAALSSSDDTPPSAEERRLRRMLCLRCHGTAAYMDDGEASFGGDEFQRPTDYLRESLDSIEQAWADKTRAEAESAGPQPNADGWIPWAGAECPVDEKVLVEVKLRSGSAWIDQEAQMGADWLWDHDGGADDIIFYRVVKP